MIIGIPKEIKKHECRVGATPEMVHSFTKAGHEVFVETRAGNGMGFSDDMYLAAGAKMMNSHQDIYQSEMIIKVKEPQEDECSLLKKGQILFCFLHLALNSQLMKQLLEQKVIGIAYETITDERGKPLVALALTKGIMPFVLMLADLGYKKALQEHPGLRMGLNVYFGHVTHPLVAKDLRCKYVPPEKIIFSHHCLTSSCCG